MQIPRKGEAKKVILNSELRKNQRGKGRAGGGGSVGQRKSTRKRKERPVLLVWSHRRALLPELGCACQCNMLGWAVGLWIFPEDGNAIEEVWEKGYKPLM